MLLVQYIYICSSIKNVLVWKKLVYLIMTPPKFLSSTCGNILGPLLAKLAIPGASDADLKNRMDEMLHQIDEYEGVVTQLKVCS